MRAALLVALLLATPAAVGGSSGKVVMVTGASAGFGEVVGRFLARQGKRVVLTARRAEKLQRVVDGITAAGGDAIAVTHDVQNDGDHAAAFRAAEEAFGGVDCVFANAGWEGTPVPLADWSADNLAKILLTNLMGAQLSTKHAMPAFARRGGGAVIYASSVAALMGLEHGRMVEGLGGAFAPYTASKAGLDGFIRNMAPAAAAQNVTLWPLNIATFRGTEMNDRVQVAFGADSADGTAGFNPYYSTKVGDPEDLARVVNHIVDGTTLWQPAQQIVVDGDVTFDGTLLYKTVGDMKERWPSPAELEPELRGADGGPYTGNYQGVKAKKDEL